MAMNIGKNFSESLKPKELQDYGIALLVPIWSTVVPTLIGINGWFGFITAYLVPLVVGLGLKQKAVTIAALVLMVQHLIYHYGQPQFENVEKSEGINDGNGIWALDTSKLRWIKGDDGKVTANPDFGKTTNNLKDNARVRTDYVPYGQLPAGAKLMNIGGDKVAVYDKNQMNDYLHLENNRMNDYLQLNDYLQIRNDEYEDRLNDAVSNVRANQRKSQIF